MYKCEGAHGIQRCNNSHKFNIIIKLKSLLYTIKRTTVEGRNNSSQDGQHDSNMHASCYVWPGVECRGYHPYMGPIDWPAGQSCNKDSPAE